jgi:hypothetical protein
VHHIGLVPYPLRCRIWFQRRRFWRLGASLSREYCSFAVVNRLLLRLDQPGTVETRYSGCEAGSGSLGHLTCLLPGIDLILCTAIASRVEEDRFGSLERLPPVSARANTVLPAEELLAAGGECRSGRFLTTLFWP